ncbi:MAG: flagellar biosynthesis protein FlhB [Spirochaetia bacterium]|jgi:flagellar biosynthetic protein FlhB|nr:flagellar biosynthesis protein FlhB [Spirochaetia bacterium]
MKDFLEIYERPFIEGFAFDLQLFAAEDDGRTEEATEKKVREAREKGQVAKTQELPQSLVVIFGVLVVFLFSSWIYDSIAAMTKYYLSSFSRLHLTQRSLFLDFMAVAGESAKILLPVFLAVLIAAVAGNVMQVGLQVSTHPLKMDWSKLRFDPATIMKKIFFSKQVAMNLFKSIAKVLLIGFTAYLIIMSDFEKLMTTPDLSVGMAVKIVLMGALKIILWTSVLLLVLSVPDYFFQKRELMESLKMTKQELKEEYKESMGDPHIRARIREMHRRNMLSAVPKADVIITNPTHYAVALLYDRETMFSPMVTAKGEDAVALRIREIAKRNNVPMIENRPLARQIYKDVEVGQLIPQELFNAVVLIYQELYTKYKAVI